MGTTRPIAVQRHDLLHEFGHAAGDVLDLNEHEQAVAYHRDIERWLRLPAYVRGTMPGEARGRRETIAEAVRERILDRNVAMQRYGSAFIQWLETELEIR
jgi:hypothetical protein